MDNIMPDDPRECIDNLTGSSERLTPDSIDRVSESPDFEPIQEPRCGFYMETYEEIGDLYH